MFLTCVVFCPLPTVLALALWWIHRRWPRWTVNLAADGIWCAASMFVKQLILIEETQVSLVRGAFVLTTVLAVIPVSLAVIAIRMRWRPWLLWLVACLGSLLLYADVMYFRCFGDVISAPVFLASGQTRNVLDSVVSLIERRDVWFVLDLLAAVPLVWTLAGSQRSGRTRGGWIVRGALAAICLAAFAFAHRRQSSTPEGMSVLNQTFTNVAVVQQFGPLGYHLHDTGTYLRSRWLRTPISAAERAEVQAWFDARAPRRAATGSSFGIARRRNLLVVQVESLQGFVIGLRIGGQDVTPNLNRWWKEGLAFSDVTDQTGEGRTSDAELTALTSLLPLEQGAAAFTYAPNDYVALPKVLAANGYSTMSAVAFADAFWNRRTTHPGFGFSDSLFANAFEPGEVIGWGLNDCEFLRQMAPKLASLPRPFLAWLITLSLHHPFTSFPDRHKVMNVGEWTGKPFGNYLHAMRFLDTALGELRAALVAERLADDTVIVVFGDHDAGFAWDSRIARTLGFPPYVLDWYRQDRVPWLILLPGTGAPRGDMAMAAGQTDMAPTLLALMGIDPGPLPFMGRNLLGNLTADVLVRPNGGWTDGRLFFDGQATNPARRCYDIAAHEILPMEECEQGAIDAARKRKVSRLVLSYDLQSSLVK